MDEEQTQLSVYAASNALELLYASDASWNQELWLLWAWKEIFSFSNEKQSHIYLKNVNQKLPCYCKRSPQKAFKRYVCTEQWFSFGKAFIKITCYNCVNSKCFGKFTLIFTQKLTLIPAMVYIVLSHYVTFWVSFIIFFAHDFPHSTFQQPD